jgi:hypothetical protein
MEENKLNYIATLPHNNILSIYDVSAKWLFFFYNPQFETLHTINSTLKRRRKLKCFCVITSLPFFRVKTNRRFFPMSSHHPFISVKIITPKKCLCDRFVSENNCSFIFGSCNF